MDLDYVKERAFRLISIDRSDDAHVAWKDRAITGQTQPSAQELQANTKVKKLLDVRINKNAKKEILLDTGATQLMDSETHTKAVG